MVIFGDKPVVVTMLGARNSGKTCYMSAMYSTMGSGDNLKGYCLMADKQVDGIVLQEIWAKMVLDKDEGENRFPNPTNNTTEYSFTLTKGNTMPILKYDWQDYRGGVIVDDDDETDRKKLLTRLKATDCLMLCISGEHLASPLTPDSKQEVLLKINATFINYLIGKVQQGSNNTPPSVAIVITQYDRCQARGSDLFADIKQLFPVLFESEGWLVMVCPVTLGLGLAKDTYAPINPKNIHIPMVFSLLSKMIRIQWEKIDQESFRARRNQSQSNRNTKESIVDTLRKTRSVSASIKDNSAEDGRLEENAEKLKQQILRLSEVILCEKKRNFETFFDGEIILWEDVLGTK